MIIEMEAILALNIWIKISYDLGGKKRGVNVRAFMYIYIFIYIYRYMMVMGWNLVGLVRCFLFCPSPACAVWTRSSLLYDEACFRYSVSVRTFGSGQAGSLVQVMSPAHLQCHVSTTLVGLTAGPMQQPIVRGVPVSVSTYQKAVSSPASAHEGNGYKDPRDRNDNFVTVRDRKVSILSCFLDVCTTEDAPKTFFFRIMVSFSGSPSLYAACRLWLRNGFSEETQPHYLDGIKLLPKPSPPLVPDAHSPAEQEPNEEEEEGSVEHLSPADLLRRHVKCAKRGQAQIREERLQRIARYKTKLAVLLPSPVEQHQFRNGTAAGNQLKNRSGMCDITSSQTVDCYTLLIFSLSQCKSLR